MFLSCFFFQSLDFDFASCIGDDHSEQCSTFMLMKDSCVVADSSSNGLHSKSLSSCYSLLKYVEVGLVFAPSPREGRIQEAIEIPCVEENQFTKQLDSGLHGKSK